jgi:hypothetical protein
MLIGLDAVRKVYSPRESKVEYIKMDYFLLDFLIMKSGMITFH